VLTANVASDRERRFIAADERLAAFVEIAWRWWAAVEIWRAHREPDPVERRDEIEQYHADLERSNALALAKMALIDPSVIDGGTDSIWLDEATEDY
jgi:hypothetical protein